MLMENGFVTVFVFRILFTALPGRSSRVSRKKSESLSILYRFLLPVPDLFFVPVVI